MVKGYAIKIGVILVFSISTIIYTQEIEDDEFYDFGITGGITIYAERPREFDAESIEAYVLDLLNGFSSDRKQFIETDFLEGSGFRRTGNVKYRRTESSEKALIILHGIANGLSFGIVPMKSFDEFFETDYARLPRGEYYKFESVLYASRFREISPYVLTIMELEYMLQIEFSNGTVIQDNINYYTDENINKFEELILRLPDYPESIERAKSRFSNELLRIRAAIERYKNPSEDYLRAIQNLGNSFNINRN